MTAHVCFVPPTSHLFALWLRNLVPRLQKVPGTKLMEKSQNKVEINNACLMYSRDKHVSTLRTDLKLEIKCS